jgi:hypothetical protein
MGTVCKLELWPRHYEYTIACDMAQEICMFRVKCGGKHDHKSNGKGIVGCIKQIMQAKASNIKKCPTTTAIRSQMKTS